MRAMSWESAASLVAHLKPGEKLHFDPWDMQAPGGHIGAFIEEMTGFKAPDRILGKIMGSAVTHRFYHAGMGETVFERLHDDLPDGVRSYVEPDRLHYFKRRSDGLYQGNGVDLSWHDERTIACALRGHRWVPCNVLPPREALPVPSLDDWAEEVTITLVDGERCIECGKQRHVPLNGASHE